MEYVELAIKDWSPPPKNQISQQSSLQPSPQASKYLTESSVRSSESPVNHCLSNGPSHSNHPLAKPYNPKNFQKHPPGMSPYTPPSCATTPTTPVLVKTRKGTQMTFDDMLKQLEEKIKVCRYFKVLEKCTKHLIGHSRLAFNNHESNIDCQIFGHFRQ